ncbi:hypothetical protein [uncultured Mycolicibacterium sp.]|uniref:PDC sensor domain-containing protein n=1 Tax=uncultured Mycolicibacterium sp. TaxID=2320817 RepID=UPI00261AE402|nr:hypothetical protein [uncultured Mycolicibacterium sp.]
MTANALAARLAQGATDALEPLYRVLESNAEEIRRARPPRSGLTEAHFSAMQPRFVELVEEHSALVWGMGFLAAPGVVEGRERYLAWWQRNSGGRVARLRLNFDPTSVDVYDYLQMDFFRLAAAGRARVAFGPYVDYSGSDMYTITATVPVVADGTFLGVAGADLVVGEVERRLLAVLRGTDEETLIVNAERRVLAANTPRWFVGSRLPEMPAVGDESGSGEFREVAELALGTGWVVAVATPVTDR